jgi:hypothetical protein
MVRISVLGALVLLAIQASGQNAASPSRVSHIVCLGCAKPAEGAKLPFSPRKTVLGQHIDVITPSIAHLAGKKPVIIQTARTTLIAVLDEGPVDSLSDEEIDALRAAFPKISKEPTTLDAHQLAHVLAQRILRLELDMRFALELSEDGRIGREGGPYQPTPSSHVEVFVFSDKKAYDDFAGFWFEPGVWPLAGVVLDSGPTSAALLPSLKDPAARRQLMYSTSMQLLRGLSRTPPGIQGWLQVGLAHYFEERHSGKGQRTAPGATLPPDAEVPKDWDAFVADMIVGGKVGDLGALAATPYSGLSVRSRLQSWSMVRWLEDKDPEKVATLLRHLMHTPPSESPQKALLGAMRAAYNHDLVTIIDEWKAAVRKDRSAAAK